MANPDSLTGKYLTGLEQIPIPTKRRKGRKGQSIKIKGATVNNLQNVNAISIGDLYVRDRWFPVVGNPSLVIETLV